MTPPKILQGIPGPPAFGAAATPTLDEMGTTPGGGLPFASSPPKSLNFAGFGQDTAFDPLTSSPKKFDVASMFAPPPSVGMTPTDQAGQQQGDGAMASLGGDWAGVDRWSSTIAAAAAKFGVPANLIKAVMKLESGGDPGSVSVAGATGLMQIMPFWNGTGGYSIHNPEENIMLGALILAQNFQAGNPNNPSEKSWEWATRRYLGLGGPDAYGTDHNDYWKVVSNNWNTLNSASGGGFGGNSAGFGGGTTSGNVLSLFGQGAAVHDWGEFGAASGNGLYGYGTSYGMNGTQHTGLDVAMNVGTQLFAPTGGVVTCAGTGRGSGADGGGCAAFSDYFGNGAGRIEVQLDNGAVIIYGHSSTAAVAPGQRVNAGTLLGTSGGMNSPHIHLEARVRDASMPSGWRIVDPRTVLGGGLGMGSGLGGTASYGGQQPTGYSQPTSFRQTLRNFQQGLR
jgi:murein DD-endopeptidase MepM/ murein hydrolase activator NlpD